LRSRWFHRPVLHTAAGHHAEGKRVTWLELFFDLIFVAGIIQLGDGLSEDVSLRGFGLFALHFTPLWLAWSGFTFYENRYNVDDFLHRTLVLLNMFALGAMAICSREAIAGEPMGFSLAWSAAMGLIAVMHLRSWIQDPDSRDYSRFWGGAFLISAALALASAFLPPPWTYGVWGVTVATVLVAPMSQVARAISERHPIDQEHLSERYGLLTIIVLGESFVKVLSYLTFEYGAEFGYLLKGFFALSLTCAVWWIYFDDVAGAEIKKQRGAWVVWLYGHLPLAMAITGLGVAVKKAVTFSFEDPGTSYYVWLLAGTLAMTLLSVALIDSATERRNNELSDKNRVIARVVSAAVVLLLAKVAGELSGAAVLAIMAAVCTAQVLFDMMMAPFEETEELHNVGTIADSVRAGDRVQPERGGRPPDVSEAVRIGAPSDLRRDFYFFFLEGSWTRLILSFGFLYVLLNLVFACLFMLEPASVGGTGQQSFADAFAFSVQTFSTVGFGSLSPGTPYGNALVAIEVAVGILMAAIATGIIINKLSRPQSAVLFSDSMVVTTRNGQPTLVFRAANARGNEVVDATIQVVALMDELTPEGHHMRRVLDLNLLRRSSPMFALSWTVFHTLDEDSPLFGLDLSGDTPLGAIIVTLLGHDATYGSTTHARNIYMASDIRVGERFVDVIGQLDDGRLTIDLTKFHDTVPDQTPGA
jgi:low temperature requirement protein LtrA